MAERPNESAGDARTEVRDWYLGVLLPKLARAGRAGVVAPQALEALDADVRALLDLSRHWKDAA